MVMDQNQNGLDLGGYGLVKGSLPLNILKIRVFNHFL